MSRAGRVLGLLYIYSTIRFLRHIVMPLSSIAGLTGTSGDSQNYRIGLDEDGGHDACFLQPDGWSQLSYCLMMHVPFGRGNRWRARHHVERVSPLGIRILRKRCRHRDRLPAGFRGELRAEFDCIGEAEQRTATLDLVASRE